MKFKKHVKIEHNLQTIDIIPLVNVIFLLLIFIMLLTPFTFRSGIDVHLPKTLTSDVIKEDNFVIIITGENLIYVNGKVTTLKELNKGLISLSDSHRPILIKADRRASVGRIVEVWDLCRRLGIERIHIATTQES